MGACIKDDKKLSEMQERFKKAYREGKAKRDKKKAKKPRK